MARQSHIFAAAVREELETRPLREASAAVLTSSQLHLLKRISLRGRQQLGTVATFLGVSSPAATKNIDKLEALGLVRRQPSTGDRRATLLAVSARGRALVDRYERRKAARLVPVLARFRNHEVAQLSRLLARFSLALLAPVLAADGDGVCSRCDGFAETDCPIGHLRGGCPYEQAHVGRRRAAAATHRPVREVP